MMVDVRGVVGDRNAADWPAAKRARVVEIFIVGWLVGLFG